jgi:hypothetical protein
LLSKTNKFLKQKTNQKQYFLFHNHENFKKGSLPPFPSNSTRDKHLLSTHFSRHDSNSRGNKMPSNDYVPKLFAFCMQTNLFVLFSPSHNNFLHMPLFLFCHFTSPFVLDCSLLFVHDGAAPTAIWLIKSVIELCDMNNLLLFSRAHDSFSLFLSCSFHFSFHLLRVFSRKYISTWHEMCCVCCIYSTEHTQHSGEYVFLFPENVNIKNKS